MFLIGIFSTPLPYVVMAFAYLIGMGMGIFKQDKNQEQEEIASNIINYEILSPEADQELDAIFTDFIQDTNHQMFDDSELEKAYNFDLDFYNSYSPPQIEFIPHKYLLASNLYNRPPPSLSGAC